MEKSQGICHITNKTRTNESFNDQKDNIFIFITQYNYSHALEKRNS
jgi:hypothetical protein